MKEEEDIKSLDNDIEELELRISMAKADNELIISRIQEKLALLKEMEKMLNKDNN